MFFSHNSFFPRPVKRCHCVGICLYTFLYILLLLHYAAFLLPVVLKISNTIVMTCWNSKTEPQRSVGSVHGLRTGCHWIDPRARPIFCPRIDDSPLRKYPFLSLTAVQCFGNVNVGQQPVVWMKNCAEYC